MSSFSIIGLGKLGSSMAAAIASRGHEVVGVDVKDENIRKLNAGRAPVEETHLEETIASNVDRLRATGDVREAVHATDMSFLVVPTPSDDRGAFSLQYLRKACRDVGEALASKPAYHDVVITSTVLPGSTRYGLLPILEEASGKNAGEDFGLCYSPEFIALGSIIRDFLNPDFTLVGEYDVRSGEHLEEAYDEILENDAPCKRMSLENAELAKVAVNTFVTTKVTFANMIADLCERIPGGDVDAVTDALGEDKRIGHAYLTGALGYGGPCFPRDNQALSFFARQIGSRAALAEVTDSTNRAIPGDIADRVMDRIDSGARVAVLGLAYKPDSHVVEESQGVALANAAAEQCTDVVAYDPLAQENARRDLNDGIELAPSLSDCLTDADVVLITTRDPEFRELSADDFGRAGEGVRIVDFWRILDGKFVDAEDIEYLPWGRDTSTSRNTEILDRLWSESEEEVEV